MKSFKALCYVVTMLLTGEWAADTLARNERVLMLILAAAGFWYLVANPALRQKVTAKIKNLWSKLVTA